MRENQKNCLIIRKRTYSTVTDWIVKYTPYTADTGVRTEISIRLPVTQRTIQSSSQPEEKEHTGSHGRVTHSFHKICYFHYEMSSVLKNYQELKELPLHVTGMGDTNYYKYFQLFKYRLKFDTNHNYDCILFGQLFKNAQGKYGIKRYEPGFGIKFWAKFNDMDVTIYIPAKQILEYRHRNALYDVLENHDKFLNLTAYFVPKPNNVTIYKHDSGHKEVQIAIADLNYFRLIGTPIKE